MAGGPSHLETFDPKPLLNKLDGQPRPAEFGDAKYQFIRRDARLLGTRRTFQKVGRNGIEVSDLFPHTAKCIDDIALVRSCHGDMVVHSAAQYELFTGRVIPGGEQALPRPNSGEAGLDLGLPARARVGGIGAAPGAGTISVGNGPQVLGHGAGCSWARRSASSSRLR